MHILKFGGTSMGDDETWQQVLDIINRYDRPFVVVSATDKTTRQLIAAAQKALDNPKEAFADAEQIQARHREIITNFIARYPNAELTAAKECNQWIDRQIEELKKHLSNINEAQEMARRIKDDIASIGERLSSYLFAKCATVAGYNTTWVDATDIIRTDSDYGQASPVVEIINEQATSVMNSLETDQIPVMGGYYGQDANGNITTLGFEGSDYTASLIGSALSADAIEIWTDVSGIYTCDPRLISDAEPIPQLSFQEATELAYFGAKVLHPSTTKPAAEQNIPVWVKNIFDPDNSGTCISHETISDGRVKAMTFKENCAVVTVTSSQTVMGYEFLAGVFDILRWHSMPVDVVTTTEASVSIAIEHNHRLDEITEQLKNFGSVEVLKSQGMISLVGCAQYEGTALIKDILSEIEGRLVNLISFSKAKGNLNIVTDSKHIKASVKAIHQKVFNSSGS